MYSCTNKQTNKAILRTFLLVSRKNCWSIITEKIQLSHKENIGFVPWEIAFYTKVPVELFSSIATSFCQCYINMWNILQSNLTSMDNSIKLNQWLGKLNKNNHKIKTKFYIFETNILSLHYHVWSKEIILNNIKKQQVVIYITLITNIKVWIPAFCVVENCPTPTIITEQKWSKEVKMFLINHDMH